MLITRARQLHPPPEHPLLRVLGFRPKMSCCMVTSVVQELLYHGEQYGTPVYIGVADVKTAFDVVSHDLLQRAMELFGLRAQAALADIGSSE
eukprot:10212799-Alexandrium_andersonii.AAC.1